MHSFATEKRLGVCVQKMYQCLSDETNHEEKQIGVANPNTTISELPAHTIEVTIDNGFSRGRQRQYLWKDNRTQNLHERMYVRWEWLSGVTDTYEKRKRSWE